VMLSGRAYALGRWADRLGAVVQAFFPGEEGGAAVAAVLAGAVAPSARLPIGVPQQAGGQPSTYLAAPLGHRSEVSSVDPTPLFPFGHGLSYTTFGWSEPTLEGEPVDTGRAAEVPTDGRVRVGCTVTNTGDRAGTEVVQLYLHDPVAQVTRPVIRLIGYARVGLEPGRSARVEFTVPADVTSFTGRAGRRIVEPGDIELRLAASSTDVRQVARVRLVGPERETGPERELVTGVTVSD
jgi:beta-xylosidase